jgi:hypothetical protein
VQSETPYNPLEKQNLGISVANALLARPMVSLPPEDRFVGAGVYAIYYSGDFPLYARLSATLREPKTAVPIYIGKAALVGTCTGEFGFDPEIVPELFNKLWQHAESIKQTRNLSLHHFSCRYLVVDDIWIPLGESLLIEGFVPLWNKVLDGFGNHDPGKGRQQQQKSPWDVIHGGRAWAERLQPNARTEQQLTELVQEYILQQLPNIEPAR